MTELPDGSLPHALVADIDAPALEAAADHHLRRVRRLEPGAALTVTDGRGRWRRAVLGSADGELEVDSPVRAVEAPRRPTTVAFALTKGAKPDLVVQKLTELGIDRIVPFAAERSVVRWSEDKIRSQHDRWEAIARGALEQSRRVHLPEVVPLVDFDHVVGPMGAVLLDRGGEPLGDERVVAVGPEGGWSSTERRAARCVAIGPNVLRAETAAIAAAVLLTADRP